jgi:hypothetical protein
MLLLSLLWIEPSGFFLLDGLVRGQRREALVAPLRQRGDFPLAARVRPRLLSASAALFPGGAWCRLP